MGAAPESPTNSPNTLPPYIISTPHSCQGIVLESAEHLPTAHGFDEFLGSLYHLNAEEEPENPDYPKAPEFRKRFGPRGVIKSSADGKIQDTGPLTKKRMETVDEEFLAGALDFMDRAHKSGKPFFLWLNSTRMHIWTHLKKESEGKTGLGIYPDGMVEHDGHVGQLLKKLDELGIADNTIVMYSTDNGTEAMSWPDGGITPFRAERSEGVYRRWRYGSTHRFTVSGIGMQGDEGIPTRLCSQSLAARSRLPYSGRSTGLRTKIAPSFLIAGRMKTHGRPEETNMYNARAIHL